MAWTMGSRTTVTGVLAGCLGWAPVVSAAPAQLVIHSDVSTDIESDADTFVSMRYMRHLWRTHDGVEATVVQQGGTTGLGLYSSFDDGQSWTWEQDLPAVSNAVSDGLMLTDGSLLLVTSVTGTGTIADVSFLRLDYDAGVQQWILDPPTPSTVYASNEVGRASRATLARDSTGRLWCAFRLQNTSSGYVRIRLFFSDDGGASWQDSLNVLATPNAWPEKGAKVLATGTGIGVVVHDVQGPSSAPVRSKTWAFRDDLAHPEATMSSELIAQMEADGGDPYGSHWSVASDSTGDIHVSYQDGTLRYVRHDASLDTWSSPIALAPYAASYNSVSVAETDDVYVFARFNDGGNMWVRRRNAATQMWSGWGQVSASPHQGLLRVCSPERVWDRLPVLYQIHGTAPFELLHALLAV